MKVMRAPKMDVVRFTESDVIVASSPVEHKYATLGGWGTGSKGDAYVNYRNGHNITYTYDDLVGMSTSGIFDGSQAYSNNGSTVTLGDLVAGRDADGLYSGFNGEYETLDGGRTWSPKQ